MYITIAKAEIHATPIGTLDYQKQLSLTMLKEITKQTKERDYMDLPRIASYLYLVLSERTLASELY